VDELKRIWKPLANGSSLAFCAALVLTACSSGGGGSSNPILDPKNAFGGPAPSGAQVVSSDEFVRLSGQEGFALDTLKLREDRKAKAQAQFQADTVEVQRLAAQFPAYNKALSDPDPSLSVLPDGNYRLTLTGKSGPFEVVTDGKPSLFRDMLESRKRFDDPANQLRVYRTGFDALPDALKTGLSTPDSLSSAGLAALLDARRALGQRLAANPAALADARPVSASAAPGLRPQGVAPDAKPSSYPASPSLELGAGKGLDHDGCSPTSFGANGLYQNFWWRQKFYATSVKDQGRRGACSGFALTAALESRIAIEQGRWVNLSEQFLWGQIAAVWDPREYGDGSILPNRAEDFHEQSYALPLEQAWNYNQSPKRQENKNLEFYYDSCIGYDEYCSNASHQLHETCTYLPGNYTVCAYIMPPPTGERFKESKPDTIFDWYNDAFGLPVDEMRQYLRTGHPMVAGLIVHEGFKNPNNQGYVTTLSDNKTSGRHAVQVVGFVSNDEIQANPAISSDYKNLAATSGGGYFIVKNSWGYCWGDAGFVYVPETWAKAYFTQVTVFDAKPSNEFKSTPNAAPSIQITAPTTSSSFPFKQQTTYTAQVSDPDSPAPDVTWTSDVDGPLGSGSSITYAFSSPGQRTITATATDDKGAQASTSITVKGVTLAPKVFIDAPLPNATIYAGSTQVNFQGSSMENNGAFGTLPCSSLVWTSSNPSDTLGAGCAFTAVFTTVGQRTITLKGTDAYGLSGSALLTINVQQKPASGPPLVKILEPVGGKLYSNPQTAIGLSYSLDDPGGTPTSQYAVIWKIKTGTLEQVITPKTCTVLGRPYACFVPADYGYGASPAKSATVTLTITDPENLTGTDSVAITIGVPG
jgi:hypothetical protein